MDASNVSFGKSKSTGAVFVAPAGTAVPTDGTSTLAEAFKNMGYISEDGYTCNIETDTEEVKEWNGSVVLEEQSSFKETHTVNFLETNAEVLKVLYGDDNVTATGNNITVHSTAASLPEHVVVVELVLTGGRVKRIVIPHAKMADRSAETTYNATDAITYPAKFSASPDSKGDYHVEYIATTEAA